MCFQRPNVEVHGVNVVANGFAVQIWSTKLADIGSPVMSIPEADVWVARSSKGRPTEFPESFSCYSQFCLDRYRKRECNLGQGAHSTFCISCPIPTPEETPIHKRRTRYVRIIPNRVQVTKNAQHTQRTSSSTMPLWELANGVEYGRKYWRYL